MRAPLRLLDRVAAWLRGVTLQRRVFYLTTVAVALAVAATGTAAYLTLRVSLYRALDDELISVTSTLTVPVAQDITNLGGLTERALRAGDVSVAAVRADGAVFYVPDERDHLQLSADELAVARMQGGASARSGRSDTGEQYRIVALPITQLGNYALVLGRPLAPTQATLRSLLLALALFGGGGVLLAALAGASIARSGLRPVRELAAAVEHVTETDDLQPVRVTATGDLAMLADAFNEMLSSVRSSRDRQRQLIADAGHELRTPLTSLRTNIELLSADATTGMLTQADRVEILADVNAQLREFTALIGDLVHLAREDAVAAAPEPIDFRTVINSALERVRRRRSGIDFDVELNPFWVVGESDTLERAVTNLLDNAVKWSPPGGTVRVQLEGGRLRVADEGPGIAEADLPHVFDRFFRAETSRGTPGTGLGLSIVAQAVARHGGWVRAGRSAQGGAEFTIQLPCATTAEGLAALTGPATVAVPPGAGSGGAGSGGGGAGAGRPADPSAPAG